MMTKISPPHDKNADKPRALDRDAMPPVLPQPQPMPMPHQDLAISPVIIKLIGMLRWPGSFLRSLLLVKRHHTAREAE